MSVYEIAGSILLIITCLLVIVAVALQHGKSGGATAALGGRSEAAGRADAKSNDAKLCKATKILAVVFFVATIGVYACNLYL